MADLSWLPEEWVSGGNCKFCGGIGHEVAHEGVKRSIEGFLNDEKMTKKELSAKLRISAQFLGDLMLGRRRWTMEHLEHLSEIIRKEPQWV